MTIEPIFTWALRPHAFVYNLVIPLALALFIRFWALAKFRSPWVFIPLYILGVAEAAGAGVVWAHFSDGVTELFAAIFVLAVILAYAPLRSAKSIVNAP
jgi:hypothetical protein